MKKGACGSSTKAVQYRDAHMNPQGKSANKAGTKSKTPKAKPMKGSK